MMSLAQYESMCDAEGQAYDDAEERIQDDYGDLLDLGEIYAQLWQICGGIKNGAEELVFDTLNESFERKMPDDAFELEQIIPWEPGKTAGVKRYDLEQSLIRGVL